MTHRRFDVPEDPIYIPLHVGRATSEDLGYQGDDTGESISQWNKYYGELTGVYWVWKNVQDADVIGICHYRRYFLNKDRQILNRQNYEEILKDYDIITSNMCRSGKSCQQNYAEAHNIKDLLATGDVIKEKYPEYFPYFEAVLSGDGSYYGNLMVTSKKLFGAYAEWLFNIFYEVEQRIDVSTYDLYHQRVFGFISEILLKVWTDKNQLKVYESSIGIVSEKAETVEFKRAMAQLVRIGEISDARKMFYEYLELRPDIRLELSDIKGEIPIIEQLLYIAEQEQERGVLGLIRYSEELNDWIVHYRRVQRCLQNFSKGETKKEDVQYILEKNVSWVMGKVMLMNDFAGMIDDTSKALQILFNVW